MICNNVQCMRSTSHAVSANPVVASHSGFARRVRIIRRCRGYEELASSNAVATGMAESLWLAYRTRLDCCCYQLSHTLRCFRKSQQAC